jgi:hypothetical protein
VEKGGFEPADYFTLFYENGRSDHHLQRQVSSYIRR